MVTSPTPAWSAARSGLLGDTGAVDASAQINQFLGTHPNSPIYVGNSILTPVGGGSTAWQYHLDAYDIDQPFTMSGTTIGRVMVPMLPVGDGADLIVSLCADSAGNPGTVITQTLIPASWIKQLAAVEGVAGPSSESPTTQYTNSPLATAQFYNVYMGTTTLTNWSFPNIAPGFSQPNGSQTYVNNYIITTGAINGTTFYNNVFSIAFDAIGNLSQAIPQPGMPEVNNGNSATGAVIDPTTGDVTLVVAGGRPSLSGITANVYTAAFDTGTGVVSSWTAQAALPQPLELAGIASWNGYVYVIDGVNSAITADINTVYYAQVQNGQITAWNTASPYPLEIDSMNAVAVSGFLVVFGGEDFAGTNTTACYYAPINADGSLGNWLRGPSVPQSLVDLQFASPSFGSYAIMAVANGQMYILSFGPNGPDTSWQVFTAPTGGVLTAEADGTSDGMWMHYGVYYTSYATNPMSLTPRISVPLPATGLTNGATYHVLLRQANGSESSYLRLHDSTNVFPGNPTVKTRTIGSSTWTAGTTGHAVPIQIYDNSNGSATQGSSNNQVLHTWDDNGARISTLVRTTTPDQRLLGLLEATMQPGPVLNQTPTFVNGLGQWTATNGALAQSSAQTHGSLPYSGLLTPAGGNPDAYIQSEYLACTPGPGSSYTVTAWVYSPTGWSAVFPNLNFYDASKTFISSGAASFNVPAATWTQITATYPVPDTALYLTIDIGESSTPAATNLLYVSAATVQDALGPQLSSVMQINYSSTWPGSNLWPPTGVTVLA